MSASPSSSPSAYFCLTCAPATVASSRYLPLDPNGSHFIFPYKLYKPIHLPLLFTLSTFLCFSFSPANTTKYRRGSIVEVQINELGFEDSFYRAEVLSYSRLYGYFLRFETLLEDNEIDPLTKYEVEEHIRPVPDLLPVTNFSAGDVVETNACDGWWIGRVIR